MNLLVSLKRNIFFFTTITLLTIIAAIGFLHFMATSNINTHKTYNKTIGTTIASEYSHFLYNSNSNLDVFLQRMSEINVELNTTTLITDYYGTILYTFGYDNSIIGQKLPHPIISNALLGHTTTILDVIPGYFNQKRIITAIPVTVNDKTVGSVVIIASENAHKTNHYNALFITVCAVLIFLVLTVHLHYVSIGRPNRRKINELIKASKNIAQGNFDTHLDTHSPGLIGDLSRNIADMSDKLSALEHSRIDYIANISHDFRSPLTSIKGFVEAMLDGTIPENLFHHYLNIIHEETQRLTELTSELLTLNSLAFNKTRLDKVHFDVHTVINRVVSQFEKTISEQSLHIHYDLKADAKDAYGDLNQIHRVIYNLFNNAIKFSKHDGSITFKTFLQGDKIHVSIIDTGYGIAKSDIPYIFNRFFKGDKSRSRFKSSGIGLAIVKEIINSHDENIFVESELNQGTTFTFTIARYDASNFSFYKG